MSEHLISALHINFTHLHPYLLHFTAVHSTHPTLQSFLVLQHHQNTEIMNTAFSANLDMDTNVIMITDEFNKIMSDNTWFETKVKGK